MVTHTHTLTQTPFPPHYVFLHQCLFSTRLSAALSLSVCLLQLISVKTWHSLSFPLSLSLSVFENPPLFSSSLSSSLSLSLFLTTWIWRPAITFNTTVSLPLSLHGGLLIRGPAFVFVNNLPHPVQDWHVKALALFRQHLFHLLITLYNSTNHLLFNFHTKTIQDSQLQFFIGNTIIRSCRKHECQKLNKWDFILPSPLLCLPWSWRSSVDNVGHFWSRRAARKPAHWKRFPHRSSCSSLQTAELQDQNRLSSLKHNTAFQCITEKN